MSCFIMSVLRELFNVHIQQHFREATTIKSLLPSSSNDCSTVFSSLSNLPLNTSLMIALSIPCDCSRSYLIYKIVVCGSTLASSSSPCKVLIVISI